jgi:hypothetical protein
MPRGGFHWTAEKRREHSEVCRASCRLTLEQKICIIFTLERPAPPQQVTAMACIFR